MADIEPDTEYECRSCEVSFTINDMGRVSGVSGVNAVCPVCGRGDTVQRTEAENAP